MKPGIRIYNQSALLVSEWKPDGLSASNAAVIRQINGLYTATNFRGKGDATWLMRHVCGEADQNGMVLVLSPEPGPESPLDECGLIAWYEKLGFSLAPNGDGKKIMVRRPQKHE